MLRKIRTEIPIEQRILFYNYLVKLLSRYVILTRILELQKRTAQVILVAKTRSNSVNLLKKLLLAPVL